MVGPSCCRSRAAQPQLAKLDEPIEWTATGGKLERAFPARTRRKKQPVDLPMSHHNSPFLLLAATEIAAKLTRRIMLTFSTQHRPKAAFAAVQKSVGCWADCVVKLFLGVRTKFSRGAGALIFKSCGGSHDQSDFQPAAFVSSLQGIGSRKPRFDGHAAKFCRHLIFEFCNTIGLIATFAEESVIRRWLSIPRPA